MNSFLDANILSPRNSFDSVISAESLRVWYPIRKFLFTVGYVRAVDGVTFGVRRGEVFAIVGESGCGKSTLAKAIVGLVPVTAGNITFEGVDLTGLSKKTQLRRWYSRQIGYVQQDPYGAVPPFMNVRTILEEPLRIHKVRPEERLERIIKSLEDVGLTPPEDFLSKYPHMLSGGQLQRVVISRAIVMQPKLIVADEPVSMLDASTRIDILTLFKKLREKYNITIIYITHDLATAKYFSSTIAVMYAGQLVEIGDARGIIYDPKHPYTEALLNALPDPDPQNRFIRRRIMPGEPPNLINPPQGCRLSLRCPYVKDICKSNEPPLMTVGNRFVKCWLYMT
ncbi:MAG: ABC transporter ATP-binding protein [Thermoproteota archaeon]